MLLYSLLRFSINTFASSRVVKTSPFGKPVPEPRIERFNAAVLPGTCRLDEKGFYPQPPRPLSAPPLR